MRFTHPRGHVFLPEGGTEEEAWQRTTHLGLVAHPDDLEFLGWHPIQQCLSQPDLHLTGLVATDGRSSPRTGVYAGYSDEQMVEVRLREQRQAAVCGRYAAVVSLMHEETGEVMGGRDSTPLISDFREIVSLTRPSVIFTHNLCDRHPHHIVVVLAAIKALRQLGPDYYPREFYGGEAWRGLDWMNPPDRLAFPVGEFPHLMASLMGVFDSQISGGKRYDLATAGRKRANATYAEPLETDQADSLEFAMDLMPLLRDPHLSPVDYAGGFIENFRQDVRRRIEGVH